jgi:hypothetical protein
MIGPTDLLHPYPTPHMWHIWGRKYVYRFLVEKPEERNL